MVNTLQEVLSPLFITCFIMGLGFYPRKQPKIRQIAYLNILYILTNWFAYAYLLFYTLTQFTRKTLFESPATEIVQEINFLLSIMSAIMSFYHQKRIKISMKKLAAVDDTLEKLGTPKMYKKLHTMSKQIIIGWILYSLSLNIFDTIWWLSLKETAAWALFIAYILNHCFHINALVDILFIFFLWYIGTRFDRVNEHMRCLVKENHERRCTRKKFVVALHRYNLCTDYKQILWTSMHLHLELCRLGRELNLIFAVQMTFEMVSYLPYLTSLFYYIYTMLVQEHRNEIYTIYDWFSVSIWGSIFLTRIYIVNYICESITVKANGINKIIHQLTNILRYIDIKKEIYQFTLQTMHHPLKFTGMGLFYFGYGFLRKVKIFYVYQFFYEFVNLVLCLAYKMYKNSRKHVFKIISNIVISFSSFLPCNCNVCNHHGAVQNTWQLLNIYDNCLPMEKLISHPAYNMARSFRNY